MTRGSLRFAAAAAVGLCVAAIAVAVASATLVRGGHNINSARVIPLNRLIHGHLAPNPLFSGYGAEFFKVNFLAGDHVTLRTQSLGGTPPCQSLYPPGTDDGNFGHGENKLNPTAQGQNGTVDNQTWVVSKSGTYVLVVSDFFLGTIECLGASQTYSFTVTAPHVLQLTKLTATPRNLTAKKKATIVVVGKNGAGHPVSRLPLVLYAKANGQARMKLAGAKLSHGKATFTFTVPARLGGKTVTISASGGDGKKWAGARVARTFSVR